MADLIVNPIASIVTMTSREIALLTAKDHRHVLADARVMLESLGIDCAGFSAEYKDASGKSNPMFVLPKRETLILVSGYSIAMRAKIIDRWQDLEAAQSAPAFKLPDFTNPAIAARAWADAMEAAQIITIERDHAIATKAQIGTRREATAMATASAAKKEAASLKERLGFCANYATVVAVQNATSKGFDWLPLRRWCKEHNYTPTDVQDKRYGTVKAWPAGAWANVYGVDLMDLFGEVAA